MKAKSKRYPSEMQLDQVDRKILALLQEDALLPLQQVAARVNLSVTPCWRRIQRLRESGVIRANVAILDPARVGLPVSVFVAVKSSQHSAAWLERFAKGVKDLPEVVEFYRMSGEVDYLLRVVVPDINGYDVFYKKLIKVADLTDVSSSFAMEQIKYTTALPLEE
jgi:Lrp/AsnC family transcriptional regulator